MNRIRTGLYALIFMGLLSPQGALCVGTNLCCKKQAAQAPEASCHKPRQEPSQCHKTDKPQKDCKDRDCGFAEQAGLKVEILFTQPRPMLLAVIPQELSIAPAAPEARRSGHPRDGPPKPGTDLFQPYQGRSPPLA